MNEPREGTRSRARSLVDDLVLVALVALVFGRSVRFPFLDWDDVPQIVLNPVVRHPLASGWRALLFDPPDYMGYPQPLTVLSQYVDGRLGGFAPWAFHLTNLILHGLNVALVRRLVLCVRPATSRASGFFAAALFACHPIVAESVCWCTGRKDLLALTFLGAGFLFYRRALGAEGARAAPWVAAVGLAFVGALGAKPSTVIFPVLIAIDLVVRRRRPPRWLSTFLVTSAGVSVLWVAHSLATQAAAGATTGDTSVSARLLLASQHVALQARNVVFPVLLAPVYEHEKVPHALWSPWGMGGVFVVTSIALSGWVAHRRDATSALLGLAWFAVVFAPSSGLVPLSRGPADTYAYAALPGIAVCAACGLDLARAGLRPILGWAGVAVFAFLGWQEGSIWQSSSALWERNTELYPEDPRSWWHYGEALMFEGRPDRASDVLEQSLARFPRPPAGLLLSLGTACSEAGRLDCSVQAYGEIVRRYTFGAGEALRFLSAYDRAPDARYGDDVSRATRVASAALGEVEAAEDRDGAAREFFVRFVREDLSTLVALERLSAEPTLADAAGRVLRVAHDAPSAQ